MVPFCTVECFKNSFSFVQENYLKWYNARSTGIDPNLCNSHNIRKQLWYTTVVRNIKTFLCVNERHNTSIVFKKGLAPVPSFLTVRNTDDL